MAKLLTKLNTWAEAGLITASQAQSIQAFEDKDEHQRSWLLYGAMAIGVTTIGIGIISIVAANWNGIPVALKVGIYLLLQIALGIAVLQRLDRPGAVREALIGLFALFFFAGIGLTAQIFHLKSDGWSGIVFWCALTLPAVLFAHSRPLPYLWFVLVLSAESLWLVANLDLSINVNNAAIRIAVVGLSLYAYLAIGIVSTRISRLPPHLGQALRVLPSLIILIGGSVLGQIIWYTGVNDVLRTNENAFAANRLQIVPWVGAVIFWMAASTAKPAWKKSFVRTLTVLFVALAALISLPLMLQVDHQPVVGTIFAIGVWCIAAFAAVQAGHKRLFDLITLVITVRILTIYFEVFGSMMATGFGLILSGFFVLGVAWVWHKYRGYLARWAGGKA